jgi:hypothetical protein
VLQAIYDQQKQLLERAKIRLELMPNPAYFLGLSLDLVLDEDNFDTEAAAEAKAAELAPLKSGLEELSTQIDSLTENAATCMDSVLEFEAGMLCMACSADYEEFTTETDGEIQLKLSANTRAALLSGCCPLALQMADAFHLANQMKTRIQTANVTVEGVDLSFLASLEFPSDTHLRDACPAPILECAAGDGGCVDAALNTTTNGTAAANQLLSGMTNGLDQPELPGPSFSTESFTPNGLGVAKRAKKKKLKCKAVAGMGEDRKALRKWCNKNCNHVPKYCPTTHCDCRERRRRKTRLLVDANTTLTPDEMTELEYEIVSGFVTTEFAWQFATGETDETAYDAPAAVGEENLFEPQPQPKQLNMGVIAGITGAAMLFFLLVRIAYTHAVQHGAKSTLYHVCTCRWITLFRFSMRAIQTDADEIKRKMKKAASDLNSQWEKVAGNLEPLYMTDTAHPPDYDGIEASASTAGSFYHLWLNYAWTLPLHFKRAFLTDTLIHEVASLKEKKYLKHKMGMDEKMVTARNLLVWRRSMMVVMIIPNFMSSLFTLYGVLDKRLQYENMLAGANMVVVADDFIDPWEGSLNIVAYTRATTLVAIKSVYVDVMYVGFICQLVLVILSWIAFVANLMALVRWTKYQESRQWLLIGWFGMYLAPFLISLVPVKEFLNWEKYNLDAAFVDTLFDSNTTGITGLAAMAYPKDAMTENAANVKIFVELSVGLFTGLQTFATLVPACIALGPALIRSAKAIKILLPESSFPPVIQMVVPILFAPLVWSMYNIVLQLIGDKYLLIALIIISFSPLVNVYLVYRAGDKGEGLFRPMRGEEAVYTYRQFAKYTQILSVGAFAFLGCWAYNSDLAIKLGDLIKDYEFDLGDLQGAAQAPKIFFKVLASYFYMTSVGTDFIIDAIATLRKWEIYLVSPEKRSPATEEMLKGTTIKVGETPEGWDENNGFIGVPPPCIVFSSFTRVLIKVGDREGKTGTVVKAKSKQSTPPLTELREGKKYKIRLDDPSGNKRNVMILGEHLEVLDTSQPKRDLKELREAKLDQVLQICNSKVRHTKSLWTMFKLGLHQTRATMLRRTVSGKVNLSTLLTGVPGALRLEVTVLCAIDLTAKDVEWHLLRSNISSSDPYCTIEVKEGGDEADTVPCTLAPMVGGKYQAGESTPRTKVVEHDLNPHWNAKFVFEPLSELAGAELRVQIFDQDLDSKDDSMGIVTVKLENLMIGSSLEHWYPVESLDRRNIVRKLTLGEYKEQAEMGGHSESVRSMARNADKKEALNPMTAAVEMVPSDAGQADV